MNRRALIQAWVIVLGTAFVVAGIVTGSPIPMMLGEGAYLLLAMLYWRTRALKAEKILRESYREAFEKHLREKKP